MTCRQHPIPVMGCQDCANKMCPPCPIGERWPEWEGVQAYIEDKTQEHGSLYQHQGSELGRFGLDVAADQYNSLRAEAMRLDAQNKALREFARRAWPLLIYHATDPKAEHFAAWMMDQNMVVKIDGKATLNPAIFGEEGE